MPVVMLAVLVVLKPQARAPESLNPCMSTSSDEIFTVRAVSASSQPSTHLLCDTGSRRETVKSQARAGM